MRPLRSIATAAVLAAIAGSAFAATPNIVVPLDQSTRLQVARSAGSVLVGNPSVADVTVVDSQTLYISGRSYGSTDIVVLDAWGSPLYRGSVVVTATDVGRVSVYRGGARTDMACAPGCQVSTRPSGAAAPAAAGAP